MRADRPSWTARVVAFSRALASERHAAVVDPGDRAVKQLLPIDLRIWLQAIKTARLAPLMARASLGFIDHIALRAAILDLYIERAIEAGIDQVVILGAGLDTRAHRLECLADADVYEVDHPSTQRGKQAASRELPTTAQKLVYVSVDFERERLSGRLADSGHRAAARTLWVLEGVVPYLSEGALSGLFSEISAACPEGSRLLLSYVPADARWLQRSKPIVRGLLMIAGEPFQSTITDKALHALLEIHGLTVDEDSGPQAWASALGASTEGHRIVAYERIVVAHKKPNTRSSQPSGA